MLTPHASSSWGGRDGRVELHHSGKFRDDSVALRLGTVLVLVAPYVRSVVRIKDVL